MVRVKNKKSVSEWLSAGIELCAMVALFVVFLTGTIFVIAIAICALIGQGNDPSLLQAIFTK